MTYIDYPNKKQKHPHYEHRTEKLDQKNSNFSDRKFHHVRKVSTHKKILKSLGRIGMCLNYKTESSIRIEDLDKVCLILINDYDAIRKRDLGVGPLNDGYLVGLKHIRNGFKVFYLYDPKKEVFQNYLIFFLKNTREYLTVFYSGRSCNCGIDFYVGSLSKETIGDIISVNSNGKAHVLFITDCPAGGPVFDINIINDEDSPTRNLSSFYVEKLYDPESKRSKRTHGIFTYYFFKNAGNTPSITPSKMVEQISPQVKRFGEIVRCDVSDHHLSNSPIFNTKN